MAQGYPTYLADAEWAVLQPLLPAANPGGRPRTTCLRQVVDAIFDVLRSGCQWRLLPNEFPPYQTGVRGLPQLAVVWALGERALKTGRTRLSRGRCNGSQT